jgi:hypothetical protein
MQIDHLLQRSIRAIVAACSQEGHDSKERSETMESNYSDIQAHIRHAQQQRSKDLGEIIAGLWSQCKPLFARLQYRRASSKTDSTMPSTLMAYQYLP